MTDDTPGGQPATPSIDRWALKPREPTEAMHKAANREWDGRMSARSAGVWQAMWDASPTPPSLPAEAGEPPEDLRPWGWAPGTYLHQCLDCPPEEKEKAVGLRDWGDKRAWRCHKHAVEAWRRSTSEASPSPSPSAVERAAERIRRALKFNMNDGLGVGLKREEAEAVLAALAASGPAQGPVAWRVKDFADGWVYCPSHSFAKALADREGAVMQPLYTAQPPSGLDPETVRAIITKHERGEDHDAGAYDDGCNVCCMLADLRAILPDGGAES